MRHRWCTARVNSGGATLAIVIFLAAVTTLGLGDLPGRALAWHRTLQAMVCDVFEPWAHGTVVRATRYPQYWDYNVVRVEEDPAMSVEELMVFADEALAEVAHRRIDFERTDSAEPLRPRFEAGGWLTQRLVWMHHETRPPPGPDIDVEEVPYDAVKDLRIAWHGEDFPGHELGDHLAEAREVAHRMGVQVLAVLAAGTPVAFAQLVWDGATAEIEQVYVHPEHRGRGLGTAMNAAAIEAASDARDLWIVADDEGRPKELYSRLGFRPAWTATEALRLP
jgi:ribosomal protein S18 acetylase RimI-like enzyme